jgi:Zn-dependent protease
VGLTDYSLQQLVLRLLAMVFIAAVHGVAVAGAAVAMGDPGPRYDGRLTANPLHHLDVLGTLAGVFSAGWIRPIAVDPAELRTGRIGLVLVVLAGAAATLASVVVLRLVRPSLLPLLPDTTAALAFAVIETIAEVSLWFAIVNVLPLPPFTGAHLLVAAVPQWRDRLARSQTYAAVLLAILTVAGVFARLLDPVYKALAEAVLGG